jgi:hypothetical protein
LKLSDSQLVLEPKTKKQKWFSICKNAGAIVKCLYVKTSESDVTKVTIQEWEDEFIAEPLHFFNSQ